MWALLISLMMIAGQLSLDKAQSWILNIKNNKNKISSDDILSSVNKLTTEARAKGNEILAKLNDKLGSINMPFSVSTAAKEYITKARDKISSELSSARKEISDVETKLTQADNRASNLAIQTEDFRNQFGKQHLKDIIQDAKEGYDKISNIEQRLGGQDA